MAVIKFGSVVTGGRGSLGGSTIQPDRSGHIWRNKPMPKKSRTQAQSVIRSINKTMQAGWRSLTDQDRKVWNDYAINKPVFNRSGEKHPLSGHSLWMKYQFLYLRVNAPFELDPAWASYQRPMMKKWRGLFLTDTESWVAYPNNTISFDNGALKISYVDTTNGAYNYLLTTNDLNIPLIFDEYYTVKALVKVNFGPVRAYVFGQGAFWYIFSNTVYSWIEIPFLRTGPLNAWFGFNALLPGHIIHLKEWYIVKQ